MVSAYCPRHGSRVLLTERQIRAMHNTDSGIVMELECHDGERIFVVTGRGALVDPTAARRLVMSLAAKRHRPADPQAAE